MPNPANPAFIMPFLLSCLVLPSPEVPSLERTFKQPYRHIGDIPPPAGYVRKAMPEDSFGGWLRRISLLADPTVHLYDGRVKQNQDAQVAVLDLPVGKKNLQQCADACMRLRAEYLLWAGRASEIAFMDNLDRAYRLGRYTGRDGFEKYLEQVFNWCGTISLDRQLKRVTEHNDIRPGDVIIRGGSPGHAVMVVDMVQDRAGGKRYLLAQSYMPAQQIHILRNPSDEELSPWYQLKPGDTIRTPEWTFERAVIKRW
jgi:hypothetical protein